MIKYETTYEKNTQPLFFPPDRSNGTRGFSDVAAHMHRHVEVQYIYENSAFFMVDGIDSEYRDGLLFIFPYCVHSSRANSDCRHISFNFQQHAFPEYERIFSDNIPLSPFVPSGQLPPTFDAMIRYARELYFAEDFPLREKLLHSVISVVIGEALSSMTLIPRSSGQDLSTTPAIGRVINYCMTHLSDDLSLDAVAKALFLDKYYISKLFPAKLGVRYVEFVRSQRISRACEMLRSTDRAITDIAYDCGFMNQSTFNRVFREIIGMSPREYRGTK